MNDEVTLDGAFMAGVTAAELAMAMRSRMAGAEPAAPPDADRMMVGLFALAVLLAALVTGVAAYVLRPQPAPVERTAMVLIGAQKLVVPLALLGPSPDDVRHEVGLLRLRLAWPALGPASGPADMHVTISSADPQLDPEARLKTWSRFLAPTAWSNPGGLVVRQFSKGNAFENDELYLAAPDGRLFAALCPLSQQQPVGAPASPALEEPCRATIRHAGLDVSLRFPRQALTEWQGLLSGVRGLVDSFRR